MPQRASFPQREDPSPIGALGFPHLRRWKDSFRTRPAPPRPSLLAHGTAPNLIPPSSTFFSPSFQPVPDLNIGLHPAPMLYLKSAMQNPSRPRGPSALDARPLPELNESVSLAGSAASPVDLRTIARFSSQNLRRSTQPIVGQVLPPTPESHASLGVCVTKAPVAGHAKLRAPHLATMEVAPKTDPQNVVLKQTVNRPTTAFSMKANLPQAEPKMLARWEEEKLDHQIRASRAGRPLYVLHDGPPYANGRIHMGTAFNKILKDFVVKSKTMAGFDSPYVPGWDCHGLPIEIKVDSELGSKKARMTAVEIRRACRKYAEKYIGLQREDFKRLGVLGQGDAPYLTMSAEYQAVIAGAFVDFVDRGYVYKGLKPVHWCMKDRTALAEAEVEYENHTRPSIWVRFKLTSDPAKIHTGLAGRNVYGLIWTTTPWTIPANMAIAYNPKYEYAAVEVEQALSPAGGLPPYIVAAELLAVTAEKCGWTDYKVLAAFPGERLERAIFRHPFLERDSLGILAGHVTLEQGTGAVHTAPGHGQEDYAVGRQYDIETYCPVDAAGRFYHAEGAAGGIH